MIARWLKFSSLGFKCSDLVGDGGVVLCSNFAKLGFEINHGLLTKLLGEGVSNFLKKCFVRHIITPFSAFKEDTNKNIIKQVWSASYAN